jgi:hypothetical protein
MIVNKPRSLSSMSQATVTVAVDTTKPINATKLTVTLTDSAGAVQTADLTGVESPPWTAVFSNIAAVAGATGNVSVQALDASGAPVGSPVTATFTEVGTGASFPTPTSVTVAIS